LREAELAYRSAELEVDQAEIDLSQRRIVAPISGWVGLLDVEQGDRIGTQDAIAVITDRSSIQIEFRVPERYIADCPSACRSPSRRWPALMTSLPERSSRSTTWSSGRAGRCGFRPGCPTPMTACASARPSR
jgi:hypothetical protein